MRFGDGLCAQESVGAGDEDGVADGDFAVGDAEDGGWVLGCYMSGYAGVLACFQGGAVSMPHHRLDVRRTEDDGIVGFYAVDGSVVVAVACVVLGVVGEGSGGLAGCNKGEKKQEE